MGVFSPFLNTIYYGSGGVPPDSISPPVYPVYPPELEKSRKNRNFILSRLGELLNPLRNVHPRGAPGPPGGPPQGGPPAPGLYTPQGGWWMAGEALGYTPCLSPQPLFPRDASGGLFRTRTSLSTRFAAPMVLTHTLTREWVPSSSHSLRPRHLGRSRGLSHFAPTGWGISVLAGAIPSGGFSPSVYPREWFSPAFGFTPTGVGRVPSP